MALRGGPRDAGTATAGVAGRAGAGATTMSGAGVGGPAAGAGSAATAGAPLTAHTAHGWLGDSAAWTCAPSAARARTITTFMHQVSQRETLKPPSRGMGPNAGIVGVG